MGECQPNYRGLLALVQSECQFWCKDVQMESLELVELLSPEGLRLLDSLPAYSSTDDVVQSVAALRKAGHGPGLVAAVLNQSKLRARARPKFGPFADRMLFTEAGLEQATRLSVAAQHAGRFQRAGIQWVADLGCGIGQMAGVLRPDLPGFDVRAGEKVG